MNAIRESWGFMLVLRKCTIPILTVSAKFITDYSSKDRDLGCTLEHLHLGGQAPLPAIGAIQPLGSPDRIGALIYTEGRWRDGSIFEGICAFRIVANIPKLRLDGISGPSITRQRHRRQLEADCRQCRPSISRQLHLIMT